MKFQPSKADVNERENAAGPAAGGAAMKTEPARVEMHWTRNSKPKHAIVHLTPLEQQRAISALPALRNLADYDKDPSGNEAKAAELVATYLSEVVRVIELLHRFGFPLIVVKGLPAPCPGIATPLDGNVAEAAVKPNVGYLSGMFGAACKLGAFAYASENRGRILRAVTPVRAAAGKASSQGFDHDLGMHNDNTNQPMLIEQAFVRGKPFMNPVQGFVAINTRADVPMEVESLDDILWYLEEVHGGDAVLPLFEPEFAIRWPDSHVHAGQIAVEGVPLLVRDADGSVHSRFHASNVVALTEDAKDALDKFGDFAATGTSVIEIGSNPGDLIVYSNTRMMHRRRAFAPRFDGTDRYYVRAYLAPLDVLSRPRVIA